MRRHLGSIALPYRVASLLEPDAGSRISASNVRDKLRAPVSSQSAANQPTRQRRGCERNRQRWKLALQGLR